MAAPRRGDECGSEIRCRPSSPCALCKRPSSFRLRVPQVARVCLGPGLKSAPRITSAVMPPIPIVHAYVVLEFRRSPASLLGALRSASELFGPFVVLAGGAKVFAEARLVPLVVRALHEDGVDLGSRTSFPADLRPRHVIVHGALEYAFAAFLRLAVYCKEKVKLKQRAAFFAVEPDGLP